jgi:hypothetical protein
MNALATPPERFEQVKGPSPSVGASVLDGWDGEADVVFGEGRPAACGAPQAARVRAIVMRRSLVVMHSF